MPFLTRVHLHGWYILPVEQVNLHAWDTPLLILFSPLLTFYKPVVSIFFFSFSRSALRMIAQLWKRLCRSCPSSRRPVTASAGDSETHWLSSPRKRTSPLSLHLEKGLQRSIHCPLALCWTSPIPLRPARLWQVKCGATHLLFFIPGSTLHFTESFSSRGCRGCRSVNSLYILDDKIVKCLKTV